MISIPELIVLASAGYRATQLAVHDTILDPARARVFDWHSRKTDSPVRTSAVTLITCPYCMGWWISGALLAAGSRNRPVRQGPPRRPRHRMVRSCRRGRPRQSRRRHPQRGGGPVTRREIAAAASRYTDRKVRTKGTVDQGWQTRAWELYHLVPEVRFAATYMANAMSGATLYAGRRADDGTIEPAPRAPRRRDRPADRWWPRRASQAPRLVRQAPHRPRRGLDRHPPQRRGPLPGRPRRRPRLACPVHPRSPPAVREAHRRDRRRRRRGSRRRRGETRP